MDIGISSAVFYPMLLEKTIDKIAELGIKKIELFFNCDSESSPGYLRSLSEKIASYNIEVMSVHPCTSLVEGVYFFSDYPRRTAESIEKYKRCFEAASFLGAKYFTFHGDRNLSGYTPYDNVCIPKEEHLITLGCLSKAARDYGMTLCMENVSWCKSSNFTYLKSVLENVPEIGFTLDTKQARRAGASAEEYINIVGSKIKNIHVSDFDDKNDCLLPGEGTLDFEKIFKLLKKFLYEGDAIIEVYSSNFDNVRQIEASKAFLERVARNTNA